MPVIQYFDTVAAAHHRMEKLMADHPDYRPGDQIDLYEPPKHCGQTMQVYTGQSNTHAYEVVCRDDDAEFRTDDNGNVIA